MLTAADFRVPADRLKMSLQARLQDRVAFMDSSKLAERYLGDSIYSNMLVMGAAFQQGNSAAALIVPVVGQAAQVLHEGRESSKSVQASAAVE